MYDILGMYVIRNVLISTTGLVINVFISDRIVLLGYRPKIARLDFKKKKLILVVVEDDESVCIP